MRRAFLLLSLLATAAVPMAPAAHADACAWVSTTGTSIPNQSGFVCVRLINAVGCEHDAAGVDPDAGVDVLVCY